MDIATRPGNPSKAADYADLMIDANPERFEELLEIVNKTAGSAGN